MPSFREALDLKPDGDAFIAEITADHAQGRAAFGGLVAALGVRALQRRLGVDRPPRSVMTSFVGPASPGPARIAVELLREGRSMTHAQVRVSQGERCCASMLVALGAARPTKLARPGPPPPEVPGPEGAFEMPYLEGLTPAFTQHWALRWVSKDLPYSGGEDARIIGWVRCRDGGPVDPAMLLALLDAWPAPVWTTSTAPIAGSSATWQANFVRDLPPEGAPAEAWWLYEARTVNTDNGYSDFEARLWSQDGELVASSRQLFAEFSGGR